MQSLHLKGRKYPENIDPEDANAVVKILSKLVNLTDLRVQSLFGLDDLQLKQLASTLPLLEVWFTSESELTGKEWGAVASVSSLRKEETGGLTIFKTRRTLGLTEQLVPGNKELLLDLSKSTENFLSKPISADKVEGETALVYPKRDSPA